MQMIDRTINWLKIFMNGKMSECPFNGPDIMPYSWMPDK
jgi:hypothetical protein